MWHIIFGSLFLLSSMLISPLSAQMIVAHRGASEDAPENTMAAFRLAWEQNADAIEADFHLTADRKIICIHDKDTARVCPAQPALIVAETDLATLRALDVGSWKAGFAGETMPTLGEVLAVVPDDKMIFIEIKSGPEIVPLMQLELTKSSLKPEQVLLISFNADVVRQLRNTLPKYRVNWLTDYHLRSEEGQKVWRPSRQDVIEKLTETGATGFGSNANGAAVDKKFVDAIIDAGFEFHAWTINDPKLAERFKDFGTLSLTTNRPAFIRTNLELKTSSTPSEEARVDAGVDQKER